MNRDERDNKILLKFSQAKEELEKNKYRVQEIKCCATCKHSGYLPYTHCRAFNMGPYAKVTDIGICKLYKKGF